MAPLARNVFEVLVQAVFNAPDKGLTVLPQGWDSKALPERLTYSQLLKKACIASQQVKAIPGICPNTIVLLHLDNHRDNVSWLWAVVTSGFVPAMSSPFTNDLTQRKKHLLHLHDVLQDPIVITREGLLSEFAVVGETFRIFTIESLSTRQPDSQGYERLNTALLSRSYPEAMSKTGNDIFALMLTSGSTGHARAVKLNHGQIISAIAGKAAFHQTMMNDTFLNWIEIGHVANLTEVHLHAMYHSAEQVHVHAADLLAQPLLFLQLIDQYKVSYTFAPNFFLASVKKALDAARDMDQSLPDLSSLKSLISGGEANSTALVADLSELMVQLGAAQHFLRPGFGMTETCAGSIYNIQCPTFDLQHGREFTSLGTCIPGMRMRVTSPYHSGTGPPATLKANEKGNLEVRGANVFNGYFNNPSATSSAFTTDGWFITGDLAFIDDRGNLHLVGREKETININGVKHFPHEIEGAIEDAGISGLVPSFVAVFSHRPTGASTETLCVIYLPSYDKDDDLARIQTRSAIRRAVMNTCMARPYKIIPLDRTFFHKTALGKLSRGKIKKNFEDGVYANAIDLDEKCISRTQQASCTQPLNEEESKVQVILADVLGVSPAECGIRSTFYDLGCSSLELLQMKSRIQSSKIFGESNSIEIGSIIRYPTIQSLCMALKPSRNGTPNPYNPVVSLRSEGSRPPLWLIHPGMGEILVFLSLAQRLDDRPVYALRARGFDGEAFFSSIQEMVDAYIAAIRQVQPQGPYAIAGYSYGGTVAFEMAKRLRVEGENIPFLAIFDQPPHIKHRMQHGGWADVLLTLAGFFDLVPDSLIHRQLTQQLHREEAMNIGEDSEGSVSIRERLVDLLMAKSSKQRLQDFGLDKQRLLTWTSLAFNSHLIAREYEPEGKVPAIDVFYGEPINAVASTVEEWFESKLKYWRDFADDVQFRRVDGHHYTLIDPAHAASFAKTLSSRLEARGM
ncbi:hypothetical protein F4679DRAFT_591735 [Xylaria curta]|nr:hypothetical protein F4679DRAFT_591735 [Xylaria curta]